MYAIALSEAQHVTQHWTEVTYLFNWFSVFYSEDFIHNALETKAHQDCLK